MMGTTYLGGIARFDCLGNRDGAPLRNGLSFRRGAVVVDQHVFIIRCCRKEVMGTDKNEYVGWK